MRIVRHTRQQFAVEEKPLIWGALLAIFTLASLALGLLALTRGADWQTLATALLCLVSGYLLLSIERVWLVLDREANLAEFRCGRESFVMSVDALMHAEVRRGDGRYGFAIVTATRDRPFLLASADADAARLSRCAAAMNAWLRGEALPRPAAAGAPMLDSAPLLT